MKLAIVVYFLSDCLTIRDAAKLQSLIRPKNLKIMKLLGIDVYFFMFAHIRQPTSLNDTLFVAKAEGADIVYIMPGNFREYACPEHDLLNFLMVKHSWRG